MRDDFDFDVVNGIAVPRLPADSPVITMEHIRAVQDALDDEDARRALCLPNLPKVDLGVTFAGSSL